MPLYAVCLAESVEDDKLVSVVKANSSEEAIEHHFRKFVCASEIMKSVITDFSSEDSFISTLMNLNGTLLEMSLLLFLTLLT